jgi:hypothetical protein
LSGQCRNKARVSGRVLAANAGAAGDPLAKPVDPAFNDHLTTPRSPFPAATATPIPISTTIKIPPPTNIYIDPTWADPDALSRDRGWRENRNGHR